MRKSRAVARNSARRTAQMAPTTTTPMAPRQTTCEESARPRVAGSTRGTCALGAIRSVATRRGVFVSLRFLLLSFGLQEGASTAPGR